MPVVVKVNHIFNDLLWALGHSFYAEQDFFSWRALRLKGRMTWLSIGKSPR